MASGKTVILGDGARAASIDEVTPLAEVDPYAVLKSGVTNHWTDAGGTYTNAQVIATSTVSSNGFARVEYDATGPMQVEVEMSDLNLVTWEAFEPFVTPGYIRVSVSESIPSPLTNLTTSVSNIVASSWTRPELFGTTNDTAGQIIEVDEASSARQPVQLSQMQTAIAADVPSDWAAYKASTNLMLDGHKIILGGHWSLSNVSFDGGGSLGVISWTNATEDSFVLSNNGTEVLTALSGYQALEISGISINSSTATVQVATNGVDTEPLIQHTESITSPDWTSLSSITNSYPVATNGNYEIVVELPSSSGFIRAVRNTGAGRVDLAAPLYIDNEPVAAGLFWEGTNLLTVIGGVTNRIMMEAYP
jgi:hypothetical protein